MLLLSPQSEYMREVLSTFKDEKNAMAEEVTRSLVKAMYNDKSDGEQATRETREEPKTGKFSLKGASPPYPDGSSAPRPCGGSASQPREQFAPPSPGATAGAGPEQRLAARPVAIRSPTPGGADANSRAATGRTTSLPEDRPRVRPVPG